MRDYTDAELLRMLDLRAAGLSAAEIAAAMSTRKDRFTRNQVLGLLHRIERQTDQHDLTRHLNGTMPRRWWLGGLSRHGGGRRA